MTTPSRNGTGKHTAKPSRNGVHRLNGRANGAAVSDRIPHPETVKNGAAAAPLTPATESGRDQATGKFLPGCPPGPGRPRNPFNRRLAALREALLEAVTPSKLQQVARQLLSLALMGDLEAMRLLLAYVVGKPMNAVDPDDVDADEFRRMADRPDLAQVLYASQRMAPADAAQFCARVEPHAPAELDRRIKEELVRREAERAIREITPAVVLEEAARHAAKGREGTR